MRRIAVWPRRWSGRLPQWSVNRRGRSAFLFGPARRVLFFPFDAAGIFFTQPPFVPDRRGHVLSMSLRAHGEWRSGRRVPDARRADRRFRARSRAWGYHPARMKLRIFLTVLMLALPSVALAQTDVEKEEAQKRFDEGLKLHDANDDNSARLKFAQAWAVLKRPNVLFNLARSEQLSNHPVEALVHFADFVKMPGISSQDKDDAERRMAELRKQVGTLEIKGAPEGAKVVVDDQWTGETAPVLGEIHAMPGKRIVEIKTSTKSYRKEVTCEAQHTTIVSFEEEVRANPPENWHPPPGETEEKKKMFPPPTGAIVLAGLGAVGLGLGVGFAVVSSSQNDENVKRGMMANGVCATNMNDPICAQARSTRDAQQTSALVSTISIIGGSALIVGGVLWWLIAPRKERVTAGFVPTVGPTYAGASWSTSF